jgi:glutathione S-transferase
MLTVHHLGFSQSERIVWLCEELGIDYVLKRYERVGGKGMAPPEYKALHPMGIAPVITDGELVLGESGAICEYISQRHGDGRLSPRPDDPDYAQHLFWLHWCNGTFMATQMAQIVLQLGGTEPTGGIGTSFTADRLRRGWEMMEARLGEADFFGGNSLTTADIMIVYNLTSSRAFRGAPLGDHPHIRRYLQRIGARPAYQRAMAKAEPGMKPSLD